MKIIYSSYSKKRMKQRGITRLEVTCALKFPKQIKKNYYSQPVTKP